MFQQIAPIPTAARPALVLERDITHPTERIHALDGMRGIAIALVLLFHVRTVIGGSFAGRWLSVLDPIAARGQFGVEVFFVLSGFLITMLLLREERGLGRIQLGAFYFRRAFRILPPAFVYLGVVAVLALARISTASGDLLTSTLFVRNFFGGGSSDTGHFWTLAIEEQFYLVWPLAMLLLPRKSRLAVVTGAVAALAIFRHEFYHWFPRATLTAFQFHYDGLLVGALLALVRDSIAGRFLLQHRLVLGAPAFVVASFAVALLLSPLGNRFGRYHELFVPGLLSVCVALAINAVLPLAPWDRHQAGLRWLSSTPMAAVGLVSYSLYLWQQLFCVEHSSLAIGAPWCLLAASGAAVLSFFLIERPSLLLRRRCSVWLTGPQQCK